MWDGGGATDYSGTIIDENDIYFTNERYTNCQGIYDPNGDCLAGENTIDIKVGGTFGNPVIISNNRMWGVKPLDKTLLGGTGAVGRIGNVHLESLYVKFDGNILFDSEKGIIFWNHHHSITNNIFYNINGGDGQGVSRYRALDLCSFKPVRLQPRAERQ